MKTCFQPPSIGEELKKKMKRSKCEVTISLIFRNRWLQLTCIQFTSQATVVRVELCYRGL